MKILSYLRKNARINLTQVAQETGIPLSTIYDRVRYYDKNLISKHASLLNFDKMGYYTRVFIALSCSKTCKKELKAYLTEHPNVNSLHLINFGSDFLIEGVFRDALEAESFTEGLETNYTGISYKLFSVIRELKKEAFLTTISNEGDQNGG